MAFAFTLEQRDLADGVAALLDDRATGAYARGVLTGKADWHDLWREVTELGIAAIAVPEELGGLGLGAIELVAVCEAAGRYLVPAPLVATAGWFVPLVVAAVENGGPAEDELAARLDLIVGAGGAATLGYVDPFVASGSITLAGDSLTVADLLVADAERVDQIAFFVADGSGGQIAVVDVTALRVTAEEGLDSTRPLARVAGDSLPAIAAKLGPDALAVPLLAAAAELVGVADAMLAMATRYAGEREQFGVKIGTFQGVKHRLADALLSLERARSLTYRGAVLADSDDRGGAGLLTAARLAKAAAADAASEVARISVQVHGGVGVTAEHDVSLFFLRARQASMQLGGRDGHYAAAARSLVAAGSIG